MVEYDKHDDEDEEPVTILSDDEMNKSIKNSFNTDKSEENEGNNEGSNDEGVVVQDENTENDLIDANDSD